MWRDTRRTKYIIRIVKRKRYPGKSLSISCPFCCNAYICVGIVVRQGYSLSAPFSPYKYHIISFEAKAIPSMNIIILYLLDLWNYYQLNEIFKCYVFWNIKLVTKNYLKPAYVDFVNRIDNNYHFKWKQPIFQVFVMFLAARTPFQLL